MDMVTGGGDQRFEFGLAMLVDGLDTYVAPPGPQADFGA